MPRGRPIRRLAAGLALLGVTAGAGCALRGGEPRDVYRRAGDERVEYLEREVTRLRADLAEAEEAMISIESGLRGKLTRADAVSTLAEARIALERARGRVPWRAAACDEAAVKIEEAERQMRQGHLGTAVFFASRARRIADAALAEARRVEASGGALFVGGDRVNLRGGPSTDAPVRAVLVRATPVFEERRQGEWVLVRTHAGRVGWIYGPLLRPDPGPSGSATTQSRPPAFAR